MVAGDSGSFLSFGSYLPSVSVNRWLSVRLEIVGATIILVSASLSITALITSVGVFLLNA
jgi:hypothetical protein